MWLNTDRMTGMNISASPVIKINSDGTIKIIRS